tara:strand:+ start:3869 stop:4855 length:987 start_codon:yes stop_codon:yes gene_type:complete
MILKSYLIEKNLEDLKNKILLFYGENLGLKIDFKKKIKLINPKTIVYNLVQEEILKNPNNFIENLLNISLFSEKKIFFIEQVNDKILSILDSFIDRIDDQKIYLFAEILDKKSKLRNQFEKSEKLGIVPCYSDNEISLKNIILERLMGYDGLSSENINLIIDNCKLDRVKLNNELDKIETFFKDKKIINFKLQDLLNINENDDFNLLKDAVLCGNNKKTNKLLSDTVMENDKVLFYLNSINQRLFKLNDIFSVKNKPITQVLSDMRPPIFWKDKPNVIEQTKKWNSKKIKNVLGKTFELEVRFKSDAALDKNVAIKKLLIDICNQANF